MSPKAVPNGFHTVTPYLVIRNAAQAIEFYKRAFGAEEVFRMPGADGKSVMHAELRIGNSMVMITDEFPQVGVKSPLSLGGTPVSMHLYVQDADAAWQRATAAGARVTMPLANMFWGDRYGKLADPYGHVWAISQHIEDVPQAELTQRAAAAMAHKNKKLTASSCG